MSNLKQVVLLSEENYRTLYNSNGPTTINNTTVTYDENNLYVTPLNSSFTTLIECTTGAAQQYKNINVSNSFTVFTGRQINVQFQYSNTNTNANGIYLITNNDQSTAKPIKKSGNVNPGGTPQSSWRAGQIVTLIYDGTNWQMVSDPYTELTSSDIQSVLNS